MDFEGYILIGGRSSRMGEDKFALQLNGRSFLEIAFENLQKARLEKVSVVISKSEPSPVADSLNNVTNPLRQDALTVTDIYQNRGALGGIHSALSHSRAKWISSPCRLDGSSSRQRSLTTTMRSSRARSGDT